VAIKEFREIWKCAREGKDAGRLTRSGVLFTTVSYSISNLMPTKFG
jgi:hypothetical protein